jgi:hypothetical protein
VIFHSYVSSPEGILKVVDHLHNSRGCMGMGDWTPVIVR